MLCLVHVRSKKNMVLHAAGSARVSIEATSGIRRRFASNFENTTPLEIEPHFLFRASMSGRIVLHLERYTLPLVEGCESRFSRSATAIARRLCVASIQHCLGSVAFLDFFDYLWWPSFSNGAALGSCLSTHQSCPTLEPRNL